MLAGPASASLNGLGSRLSASCARQEAQERPASELKAPLA